MEIRSYWEGTLPPIVQKCLERFKAMYGDRFTHVSEWSSEWGARPSNLAVHHRADLAKWELLYHHGGVVVDLDCVPLRDFKHMVNGLTLLRDRHMVDVGFMGADPNDNIVNYFRKCAWLKVEHNLTWNYTALGKHVTCSLPMDMPENKRIMPIHWSDRGSFQAVGTDADHQAKFKQHAYCYMLNRGVTNQPLKPGSFLDWLLKRPVEAA